MADHSNDLEQLLDDMLEEDEGESSSSESVSRSISHSVPDEARVNESEHKAPKSSPISSPPYKGGSINHLTTCDCPQCQYDLEPVPVTFDSPHRPMTRRETLLLAYAFPAKVGETTKEVSIRTGIPESTIYRYKSLPDFNEELAAITNIHLGEHRQRVADALIEGACQPGKGQASMQRIYWQKLGELVDARSLQIEDADETISRILGIPKDRLPA